MKVKCRLQTDQQSENLDEEQHGISIMLRIANSAKQKPRRWRGSCDLRRAHNVPPGRRPLRQLQSSSVSFRTAAQEPQTSCSQRASVRRIAQVACNRGHVVGKKPNCACACESGWVRHQKKNAQISALLQMFGQISDHICS